MELEDDQTLRLVMEKVYLKVYSFSTWPEFIAWAKGMTQTKFKTFILECIDEVISGRDTEKADLLEIKSMIEG